MHTASIELQQSWFGPVEQELLSCGELSASLLRYPSGVEAVRLRNRRGHLVVLPFLGQMVWDAVFDGVGLTMKSMFAEPRPAQGILETYGCFAYHSGLLRNGCPGPEDSHALHGEMPCAPMQRARLLLGEDGEGPFLSLVSEREYAMGFGNHYLATPRVTLRAGSTLFDMAMDVRNLSGAPMDLMYICHANYALVRGGEIFQGAAWTPEDTCVRTSIPGHVQPTPAYRALLEEFAAHPERSRVLDGAERYDPEQVFFIRNLRADDKGNTHMMVRRPEGDAFFMSWPLAQMPRTIRWILCNSDQEVGAFALPGSCEPEGYLAEKRKGNVRTLAGGRSAHFQTRLGYLDAVGAEAARRAIENLKPYQAN
jgi:hypothetical protein